MPGETKSPTLDLAIIIVNWNTPDYLSACLDSVLVELSAWPEGSVETYVVDNASADHSVNLVREQYPWVKLIENATNVGFARANNQAAQITTGRNLLLLNSDTELHPGALRTMVTFLDTHPQAGAVGARLLNSDGTLQESAHPAPTLGRELWYLCHLDKLHPIAIYPMEEWPIDQPRSVEILKGACLMFRQTVLDEVGLLDEDYFMYSEEVDLCKRTLQAGWLLYWEPRAVVVHHGGRSTEKVAFSMFMHLYKGKIMYFRKRHGRATAALYKLVLAFAIILRLLVAPISLIERPPKRDLHQEMARRYYHLLTALPTL
jgi:GT2 family glycosyltransferase